MKNQFEIVTVEDQEFEILALGTGHRIYKRLETRVLSDGDMIGQIDTFTNQRGLPIIHYRLLGKDWVPLKSCYTVRDAALVLINSYLARQKNEAVVANLRALSDIHRGIETGIPTSF
jgi:hypothetical protein